MDPHITLAKCSEMATYSRECDALTYRAIRNTLYCLQKTDRGMSKDF